MSIRSGGSRPRTDDAVQRQYMNNVEPDRGDFSAMGRKIDQAVPLWVSLLVVAVIVGALVLFYFFVIVPRFPDFV